MTEGDDRDLGTFLARRLPELERALLAEFGPGPLSRETIALARRTARRLVEDEIRERARESRAAGRGEP
jgi:hypothetical protein